LVVLKKNCSLEGLGGIAVISKDIVRDTGVLLKMIPAAGR